MTNNKEWHTIKSTMVYVEGKFKGIEDSHSYPLYEEKEKVINFGKRLLSKGVWKEPHFSFASSIYTLVQIFDYENQLVWAGANSVPDEYLNEENKKTIKTEWAKVKLAKTRLSRSDSVEMRDQIVDTAMGRKNWAMWLVVFKNDEDMIKRLWKRMEEVEQREGQ